jgi:hypothetical protein
MHKSNAKRSPIAVRPVLLSSPESYPTGKPVKSIVMRRINAKLAADGLMVVELDGHMADQYGAHVVTTIPTLGDVVGHGPAGPVRHFQRLNVNLDELGRELGVLRDWEE